MARAAGSFVELSGRNDGETAYHCVVSFSWTFDDDPSGSRSVTAQASLPGWHCNAAE
jgi:hypothetical protein